MNDRGKGEMELNQDKVERKSASKCLGCVRGEKTRERIYMKMRNKDNLRKIKQR